MAFSRMRLSPVRLAGWIGSLLGVGLLGACGGSDIVLPNEGVAAAMAVVQGNNQTGSAGAALADSLVVRVTDSKGRPVEAQPVKFTVQSGGGQITPDSTNTDSNGKAAAHWVLGSAGGAQTALAKAVGNGAPASVTASFTASAGAAGAAKIQAVKGDSQTATAGSPLADSLVVVVLDQFGNPVPGVAVAWTVTGGGSVSAPSVETGADGRSGVVRLLGPASGRQTTLATVAGLTGSPVTFIATATVGTAGTLTIEQQPSASAQSGVALAQQPKVQLRDANGNPVLTGGVAIQAQITSGPAGATLSGATVPTDGTGLAQFTNLTISGAPGSYELTFSGSGISGVTSTAVTLGAGSATRLAIVLLPAPTTSSGQQLSQQPQVQLQDASGNPVAQSGVLVTATLQGSGVSLSGDNTKTTDASGVATFTDLTLTGTAGSYTLLFASNGLVGTSAPVAVGAGNPSAGQSSASYDHTTIAAGGTITITATVRDASGNAIQGAAVGVTGDGTGTGTTSTTDAAGSASVTFTSTAAGGQTLTVSANGTTISTQAITVTAAAPDAGHSVLALSPTTIVVGQQATVTVTLRDQYDNPVPSQAVTLSAGAGLTVAQQGGTTGANGVTNAGRIAGASPGNASVTATAGAASLGPVTETVTQAATTTSITGITPEPSSVGQAVTVSWSVAVTAPGAGTPTGNVTVTGGSGCSAAVAAGSCSITFTSAGSKSVSAAYAGDTKFAASPSVVLDAHRLAQADHDDDHESVGGEHDGGRSVHGEFHGDRNRRDPDGQCDGERWNR